MASETAFGLVVHLRLPFQVALSAVFLWGVFLASGRFGGGTLVAYLAFVVGLHGGATAFNSYYDRDVGPVTGLRHPPPVSRSLLRFSLIVQGVGLAVATALSVRLGLVYLVSAALFLAYSHPSVRTKQHPWLSMLTVATASGSLALLAGAWAARRGIPPGASSGVALGMIAAFLVIAGFYPLTQLGQVEEDRARGDRTFAVAYGRRAAFLWGLALLAAGGAINLGLAIARAGWAPAAGLAVALATVSIQLIRWSRDPSLDGTSRIDAIAYATAAVHAVVVAYQALRPA